MRLPAGVAVAAEIAKKAAIDQAVKTAIGMATAGYSPGNVSVTETPASNSGFKPGNVVISLAMTTMASCEDHKNYEWWLLDPSAQANAAATPGTITVGGANYDVALVVMVWNNDRDVRGTKGWKYATTLSASGAYQGRSKKVNNEWGRTYAACFWDGIATMKQARKINTDGVSHWFYPNNPNNAELEVTCQIKWPSAHL